MLSVILLVVRVEGVEPSSHAWEAYIIAVIRYPRWLYYSTLQGKRLTFIARRTIATSLSLASLF